MVQVYYVKTDEHTTPKQVQAITKRLLDKVVQEQDITLSKEVPLKAHFGEKGNSTYIKPENYLGIIDYLKEHNIKSSYMETNTIYGGQRNNQALHEKLAKEHGFTQLPVVIADGKSGEDFTEVTINQRYFEKCKIGKAFKKHKQMIILSHFKGHRMAGFGGAIKMLAMGFGTKGGKLAMHMDVKPRIKDRKCTRCNVCLERCNFDAITIGPKSFIDHDKCVGCSACVPACPHKAISIFSLKGITNALTQGAGFKKKMTEYALAAQKGKEFIYINFAMNITAGCDCEPKKMKFVTPDIGIFVSTDPVAIDKACFDLAKAQGKTFKGTVVFDYGEEIGLGSQEYELIEIK